MSTEKIDRIIDNWINGNRTEARKQARRVTHADLLEHFTNHRDWSLTNANKVVTWLKGSDNYQEACDATADEIHTLNP